MPQTSALHREWARQGAMVRLEQIDQERTAIFASFPDLRRRRSEHRSSVFAGPRKRRKMSAAARRRMAAGMRKYWAKRKAAEGQ